MVDGDGSVEGYDQPVEGTADSLSEVMVSRAHSLMVRTNFISLGLVLSAVGVVFGLYYMPDSLVSPALAFAVIVYVALAIACSINVAFMGMASQMVNSRSKFMSFFTFSTIGISVLSLLAFVVIWMFLLDGSRRGAVGIFVIPAFASIFISMKIVTSLEVRLGIRGKLPSGRRSG